MSSNEWSRPSSIPPPLYTGQKERDLVASVNREIQERVIGQTIIYYPISLQHTQYHPVYGEALKKTFLSPIEIKALIEWKGIESTTDKFGIDKTSKIIVHFHKRRLVEDKDIYVREGDFVQYGDQLYEIVKLDEPKQLFGQIENRFEITAECIKSRESTFTAK